MNLPPLCLAGTLRQSDASLLRDLALAQMDSGAVVIRDDGLEAIEFGALQVLLCTASDADRLGLSCQLDAAAVPAFDRCLAAMCLPDAAAFFTIAPTKEVSANS